LYHRYWIEKDIEENRRMISHWKSFLLLIATIAC
jgi:hypothetical protein